MVKFVDGLRTVLERQYGVKLLDIYRYNSPKGSEKAHDVVRVLFEDKVLLVNLGSTKENLGLKETVDKILTSIKQLKERKTK